MAGKVPGATLELTSAKSNAKTASAPAESASASPTTQARSAIPSSVRATVARMGSVSTVAVDAIKVL